MHPDHQPLSSSLAAHFELFRRNKLPLRSPQTVYQYRLNLKRFDEFLERPATVADLEDSVVAEAMNYLLRKRKLSPASVSKFRDNISYLWRFLSRKRVVDTEPDIAQVIEPERAPIALTRDQLRLIWDYLQRLPGDVDGIPARDWFCSLVACFWNTGARKGELFGLRWEFVDLPAGFITCRAETVKGGMRDRLYRLRPSTVDWLRRIEIPPREFVWPWPWSETRFYDRLGEIMVENGLPDTRYFKTHVLRKSVASHLLAEGGNPQQALGHSTAEMTERYLDRRICPRPSPGDRLFELGE